MRRRQHNPVARSTIKRKRKEVITDENGASSFVLVARAMKLPRNNAKIFPNTDGGDSVQEYEDERRPHMKKSLEAKLEKLKKKRNTVNGRRMLDLTKKHRATWKK